jgi:hypothetical protein
MLLKTHDDAVEVLLTKLDSEENHRTAGRLFQKLNEALANSVNENTEVHRLIEELRRIGFDLSILMEVTIGVRQRAADVPAKIHKPEPLVRNGEVTPDAFNAKDLEWMQKLKIDFGK